MSEYISDEILDTLLKGKAVQIGVADYECIYLIPGSVIENNTNGLGILITANTYGSFYWQFGGRINKFILMQHGFPYRMAERVISLITRIVEKLQQRKESSSHLKSIKQDMNYHGTKNKNNTTISKKGRRNKSTG